MRRQFIGALLLALAVISPVLHYDVMPDGKSFVMFPKPLEAQTATAGMLTVVVNWFDDLRRATGTR